jgi:hypothetical protein
VGKEDRLRTEEVYVAVVQRMGDRGKFPGETGGLGGWFSEVNAWTWRVVLREK